MKKKPADWKLGSYKARSITGLAQQNIDYKVKAADNQHFGEIIVYDTDCKKIAKKIVELLNTNPPTL